MIGWILGNRFTHRYRPPRKERLNLPNDENAKDAVSVPEIWDYTEDPPQYCYSTWEYVNGGVKEGWLVYIGHHWTSINNVPAFVTRFEILPPE
jgi:hypothetical protein